MAHYPQDEVIYQEPEAELQILKLWDQDAFDTVRSMVHALAANNSTAFPDFSAAANHADGESEASIDDDDSMYNALYQGRSCQGDSELDETESGACCSENETAFAEQSNAPSIGPTDAGRRVGYCAAAQD
jgi:hypothetical protein